jgi:cytidyltransferase-like protein
MHKKQGLDCRVVDVANNNDDNSRPGVIMYLETFRGIVADELEMKYVLYDNPRQALPDTLDVVALGGTFDRLHNGHKKLLSVAMQVAKKCMIVGVTSDSMLKNKKNASLIQDLPTRLRLTREFCESFAPRGLVLDMVVIDDPWGPTVSRADVQGIVVSSETLHGAKLINDQRRNKGFPDLLPVVILRSNQYVLSSTFARTLL